MKWHSGDVQDCENKLFEQKDVMGVSKGCGNELFVRFYKLVEQEQLHSWKLRKRPTLMR